MGRVNFFDEFLALVLILRVANQIYSFFIHICGNLL